MIQYNHMSKYVVHIKSTNMNLRLFTSVSNLENESAVFSSVCTYIDEDDDVFSRVADIKSCRRSIDEVQFLHLILLSDLNQYFGQSYRNSFDQQMEQLYPSDSCYYCCNPEGRETRPCFHTYLFRHTFASTIDKVSY